MKPWMVVACVLALQAAACEDDPDLIPAPLKSDAAAADASPDAGRDVPEDLRAEMPFEAGPMETAADLLDADTTAETTADTTVDVGDANVDGAGGGVADGASDGAGDGADAGDDGALCDQYCAQQAQTGCQFMVPNCKAACLATLRGRCGPAWRPFFRCNVERPITDFFCEPPGRPALKPGICPTERSAVEQCIR